MTDKQALREAAQNATGGDWLVYEKPVMSYMDAIHCLAKILQGTEGEQKSLYMINANGLCPALTGTGPNSANNARYLSLASPAAVLALLDELEAAEKRIEELEARTVRVELPDINGAEYWFDGQFQAMRYYRDLERVLTSAGIKCEVV